MDLHTIRGCRHALAGGVFLLLLTSWTQAAFVPGDALVEPGLTGTTEYEAWVGLTSANYPGYGSFPGSSPWPTPMAANQPGSGDATLNKIANGTGGGPYPASSSIYFGGFSDPGNINGGTLAVSDSTPVPGLQTVVFQLSIGGAAGIDFFNNVQPVLNYNGGSQALVATQSTITDQFYNGTISVPSGTEDIFINTYLLSWDLSSIVTPITSFAVQFSGVQHGQLYAVQLDQSDTLPVPEPATWCLAAFGVVGLVAAGRRSLRKRQQRRAG